MKATIRSPLFRVGAGLWLAGMIGVLSTLLMPIPLPEGTELPMPIWVAKLLNLIQPTLLLILAVWAGTKLAPSVGLDAPVLRAAVEGEDIEAILQARRTPALIGVVLGGAVLLVANAVMPPALEEAGRQFQPPLLTRLLYGGITEEVLIRWGLMTVLLWGGWRLFQSEGDPHSALVWTAIVLSALLFGAGHLPMAVSLVGELTPEVLTHVLAGNTVFGIVAGYLYWQWGLETAMAAHAGAHAVAFVAASLPVPV